MILDDGFETRIISDRRMSIIITQESELSMDGGYTFEDVCNIAYLNRGEAKMLIEELTDFVNLTKEKVK